MIVCCASQEAGVQHCEYIDRPRNGCDGKLIAKFLMMEILGAES